MKVAGIITVTPCTFGNRLSAIRSLATAFCMQKIGCASTPAARSRSSAASVSCVFIVSRIASSGPIPISAGSPTQGNRASRTPSAVRSLSPPASRIASSCAPRAMPTTSRPASASAAATVPPIAPRP